MKGFLGIAAFLALSTSPAFGTDYLYDIAPDALSPYLIGGYVVTNCDQCVLTSANVVAWSLNENVGASPGSSPLTSSSFPQSSVLVQGNSFTATSTGLFFNFHYNSAASNSVSFMSGYDSVELANYTVGSNIPYHVGVIMDCGSLYCASTGVNTTIEFGNFAKMEAPELGSSGLAPTLALLLSGLAIVLGRSSRD
jgi:hypothetical protein